MGILTALFRRYHKYHLRQNGHRYFRFRISVNSRLIIVKPFLIQWKANHNLYDLNNDLQKNYHSNTKSDSILKNLKNWFVSYVNAPNIKKCTCGYGTKEANFILSSQFTSFKQPANEITAGARPSSTNIIRHWTRSLLV